MALSEEYFNNMVDEIHLYWASNSWHDTVRFAYNIIAPIVREEQRERIEQLEAERDEALRDFTHDEWTSARRAAGTMEAACVDIANIVLASRRTPQKVDARVEERISDWVPVSKRLPSTENNPYPQAIVCLGLKDKDWNRYEFAELRFFGGDKSRPYWKGWNKEDGILENDAWTVTHWMPIPDPPLAAIDQAGKEPADGE